MALTEQKRRYAAARLSGMTKKQAAIEAGCPDKTASQAASRYEKDPDVQAAMGRAVVVEAKKTTEPPPADPDPYIPGEVDDPVEFFKQVTNDLAADPKLRLDAAKAWAQFTVAKPGEKGKKDEKAEAAKQAGKKFGSTPPPLRAVK
ncbi:terminase small subunit [Pseudomonas aeruginosa]|uniref:terminase small subunit n=1 Tax=Pseudomonas aeruginosa TaxID=287 RepID=UPI0029E55ACE|nr:terminase small subunit [Pseudomonas aeruginosa]HEJ5849097.1 terminase small subunit [Pseudomonas aeruginosa]